MTVETVKVLLLIAMFGALQAAMYLSELRVAQHGVAASRTSSTAPAAGE